MRILVDADACPVKKIIVDLASSRGIPVYMYFDTSHQYDDDYATSIMCDKGKDSVDYCLLKDVIKDDLVITQDYGLASLALAKQAFVIHNNGYVIDDKNINELLEQRYMGAVLRKSMGRIKGPSKRTKLEDQRFEKALEQIIKGAII